MQTISKDTPLYAVAMQCAAEYNAVIRQLLDLGRQVEQITEYGKWQERADAIEAALDALGNPIG